MSMIGYIYVITSPSGKSYVGQSWNIDSRWKKYQEGRCNKGQPKLYNAFKKYNPKNCIFYIIDAADTQEKLDIKEIYWIDSYDSIINGYNCMSGGSHGRHSEHAKMKMSLSQKGRIVSEETRIKLSKSHKNHQVSQSTKDKLRKINLGKRLSQQHKNKIASANKGKFVSKETRLKQMNNRIKYQYTIIDPNGEIYNCKSLTMFCKENNLLKKYMYYVALGKINNFKGWKVMRNLIV